MFSFSRHYRRALSTVVNATHASEDPKRNAVTRFTLVHYILSGQQQPQKRRLSPQMASRRTSAFPAYADPTPLRLPVTRQPLRRAASQSCAKEQALRCATNHDLSHRQVVTYRFPLTGDFHRAQGIAAAHRSLLSDFRSRADGASTVAEPASTPAADTHDTPGGGPTDPAPVGDRALHSAGR